MRIHKLFAITFLLLTSFFVDAGDDYSVREYTPKLEYRPKELYSNTDNNQISAAIPIVSPNEVDSKAINEGLEVKNFSIEEKRSSSDKISETVSGVKKSIIENKENNVASNNNFIMLTLLAICVVSICLFRKKSIQNQKLSQFDNENVFEGITGVEKYIAKLSSNKTGVTKYLEKQQQITQLTSVAKYIAKEVVRDTARN